MGYPMQWCKVEKGHLNSVDRVIVDVCKKS